MLKLIPLLILMISCSSVQKSSERTIASNDEAYGYVYFVNEDGQSAAQITSYVTSKPLGDDGNEFSEAIEYNFFQVESLLKDGEKAKLIGSKKNYLYKAKNGKGGISLTRCSKKYGAERSYCRFPRNTSLKYADLSYFQFQNKGFLAKNKVKKKKKKLLKKIKKELFEKGSSEGLRIDFKGNLSESANYNLIIKYIAYMYDGYPLIPFYR